MDVVLQGLPKVICYLDDILVTGRTAEERLTNLEKVLQRLQYGIRAKREKCKFFTSAVGYLGHRVGASGLHTTLEKVAAIEKAPEPSNVRELCAILGLLYYYEKFLLPT